MAARIAIFGGSFNPPGNHHRRLAEALATRFDDVIIVPCGPRPDKPGIADVDPVHRAVMTDLAFRDLPNVRTELFDLEQSTFTRTDELDAMFRPHGETWHVVGSELIRGGARGESFIHRVWRDGARLWNEFRYAIIPRSGYEIDKADLPPNSEIVEVDVDGSSFKIREKAFRREPLGDLVPTDVASYIDRYRLYRGTVVSRRAKLKMEPRVEIFYDERNPRAREIASRFKSFEADDPNCILVVGGDGTMLQAIRTHWRRRLPFYGVNAGHLGFLLNSPDEVPDTLVDDEGLMLFHLPLLYVETRGSVGDWRSDLAFNDTWIERAGSQTAWIELTIDGQVRIPKLVADGMLIATAAGSTAYARSMGAAPLLSGTPALVLVGSNVMQPIGFRSALLGLDSVIEMKSLGGEKRPLNAYVDGVLQGDVESLRVRVSRIAAVELAFMATHDMAEKIARLQFPV